MKRNGVVSGMIKIRMMCEEHRAPHRSALVTPLKVWGHGYRQPIELIENRRQKSQAALGASCSGSHRPMDCSIVNGT
jgi:hypothetical protein